jgi:hypothetical protein
LAKKSRKVQNGPDQKVDIVEKNVTGEILDTFCSYRIGCRIHEKYQFANLFVKLTWNDPTVKFTKKILREKS